LKAKVLLMALLAAIIVAAPSAFAADKLKVAVILPGKADDVSFNQAFYEGMKKVEAQMKDKIEVTYVEDVYEVNDIEPALMDFASRGYGLIFGHGFQFMEPIIKVAAKYPKVMFALGSGYKTLPNTCVYDIKLEEGGYLMGTLAASISKTGKIGVIGGADVSEIYRGHEAYKLGAKTANPSVQIQEFYTGDWRDAAKAKEGALGMYDSGVDVIWHSGDGIGLGAVNAALQANKWVLSNVISQYKLAPKNVVSGIDYSWDSAIGQIVADVMGGHFADKDNKFYWLTVANGGIKIADFHQFKGTVVPAAVIKKLEDTKRGIADGSIKIPDFKK